MNGLRKHKKATRNNVTAKGKAKVSLAPLSWLKDEVLATVNQKLRPRLCRSAHLEGDCRLGRRTEGEILKMDISTSPDFEAGYEWAKQMTSSMGVENFIVFLRGATSFTEQVTEQALEALDAIHRVPN